MCRPGTVKFRNSNCTPSIDPVASCCLDLSTGPRYLYLFAVHPFYLDNSAINWLHLCYVNPTGSQYQLWQWLRSSSTAALIVLPIWLSTVGDRAFSNAASRFWHSLPLHLSSAPSLQTFWRSGCSHFCSAAVSRRNLFFPATASLLSNALFVN